MSCRQAEPAVRQTLPNRLRFASARAFVALNINFGDMRDTLSVMDSLVANIADRQKMTEVCVMNFANCGCRLPCDFGPGIFQSDDHPVRELLNYLALLTEPTSANFR